MTFAWCDWKTRAVILCVLEYAYKGVPAYGIVDTGADITIIGGELFKKVAAVARLKKKDFKEADKTPRNYDWQPFSLDGRMDLDVIFNDTAIKTPVYIKMDAHHQLLLSEGICRQLGIISYHPDVEVWRGGKLKNKKTPAQQATAQVPTVRVRLLQLDHTRTTSPECRSGSAS